MKLTKDETEILCELVFLGNWVANSHRLHEYKIKKYDEFAERVGVLHREILSSKPHCKNKEGTIELCISKLHMYIDEYDDECCFATLAERLAKAHFPENRDLHWTNYCGSVNMRIDAQNIYEKELLEKGVSVLSIDIPDIDDRLEACRQEFRKQQNKKY